MTKRANSCRPYWKRISPIQIVIPHRCEERNTEIEQCLGWRAYSWSTTLEYRGYCCGEISHEVAHPATDTIAIYHINAHSTCPLIEKIREVDSGTNGTL